jgi:hypothetical protein
MHKDIIVVGAGISGIAAGYNLQKSCPNKSFAILEGRESLGGTWDLFKYPGIRSDAILPTGLTNDMVVVGYGASELEDLLEDELSKSGRYINPDPNPDKGSFYRSDHISFAKRGVPVLYADGGFDLVDGGKEAGFILEEQLHDMHQDDIALQE